MTAHIAAAIVRVASDLRHIAVEDSGEQPQDVISGGTVYRLLDAPYYAWLRRRMDRAKKAFDAGKLPASTWQALRERFNAINSWAVAHIGEQSLVQAIASLDEKSYQPPRHDHAVALIDSWEERAAIMEHDGGLAQAAAEHAAAQRICRELTPEDVESFKALGVEVDVKSSVGNFTLVPDYTDQAGKMRMEMSAEDLRKISMVMHTFPGSEITYVGPQKEPWGEPYVPQAPAPKPSAPAPTPETKQPTPQPQQPYQAPLF
ncbi:MAG: hypothetical protein M5U09_25145 [Gammaproteobacteria bacterium]|nr:hypothetical protein [Gammaproteobacteria bacterium]